ncbi:MAG: UTP--glucose-1-phosphate uridylyltransferase GalU [Rhizobiales bacterium]|nr:UTP--glucose-1-phosphate uridylyltransferase GalU [Hyphomicrobiales bacterium]NRB14724.1 UTP--glucose-1-phosphate uridylyltransferase GalU [Hyphomicrobiales bacterium]
MAYPVKTAVFPVAGLGTRFLPATKAMPKEMLTVVDKPLIQYAVEEAKEAGIEHFIFITGRNKNMIEDHFDRQYELMNILKEKNKLAQISILENDLPSAGQTSFTRQQQPLGLGHAVWCARHLIAKEPFALLLPDMMVKSKVGALKQMIEQYNGSGGNVVGLYEVPHEEVDQYGVVKTDVRPDGTIKIIDMVEKPKISEAPSNLMIMGRYILQPEIMMLLETQNIGAGGEIQLTDAMLKLLEFQNFSGVNITGELFDCGSKLGFLTANLSYALDHPEVGEAFRKAAKKLIS